MKPITFRPTYSSAAFYSAVFLIPAAVIAGVLLNDSIDQESVWVGILIGPLLAAFGFYSGSGLLCLRIVADSVGLRRAPWWFGGDRMRWSDVVKWSVRPLDPIDNPNGCQILELRIRDRLGTVRILDYEVARPGFDVLVACVKERVGAAEAGTPIPL